MIVDKTTLKTYFETGDFPTEQEFINLIDSLEEVSEIVGHNYTELKGLVDSNSLDINKRYILNDYVHKYYIDNTNSNGKIIKREISAIISGFATFGDYVEDLPIGTEVTITKLPENYSGTLVIGDKSTVSGVYSDYYFRFSNPEIHSVAGFEVQYFINRFNNITEGVTVNDTNGKPVLKPTGIINTEVHDGTPYMDMTAIENASPISERILLTPISENSFDLEAKSLIYLGDTVHFDFNDNEVKNDNKVIIGERNGFIKRRINNDLNIDVNCNWREQKFRRWLLADDNIDMFINVNEDSSDLNVMTAFEGKYLFTSEFRKKTDSNYFYIIPAPEYVLKNLDVNGKVKDFEAFAINNIKAKDFSVFELDENKQPVNVTKCVINFLENSVFQNNINTLNLNLYIDDLQILKNSTFTCYANLVNSNNTTVEKIITLDSLFVDNFNSNYFKNVNFLSHSSGNVLKSLFENVVFGTNGHQITIGSGPHESVTWIELNMLNCNFNNTSYGSYSTGIKILNLECLNSCLYFYSNKQRLLQDSIISNSVFKNATLRCLNNNINVVISGLIIPEKDSPEGWIYSIPKTLNSIEIKRISSTGELYYEEESSENDTFTKNIFVWNQATNNWDLTDIQNDIDLTNYVTLDSSQTISGEKTFNRNLGVGEQSKLKFYAPDTSNAPGAGFDLNLESEVFGVENQGLLIDSDLKLGGDLNLSNNNINNVKDITAEKFKKSDGLSTQFLKADGSVDGNTYALISQLFSGNYNDLTNKPTNSGGEPNVQSDWNATSGDALILNKPSIPTNNNQLTNGAGYITSADVSNANTLDGLDSSQFLRNDQDGTLNGNLIVSTNLTVGNYLLTDEAGIISNNALINAGLTIRNSGSGDARLRMDVGSGGFTLGVDNSDSNKFKISGGDSLGTSDKFTLDSFGSFELNGDDQSGIRIYKGSGAESGSFWFAAKDDSNSGWDTTKRFGFYETDRRWCVEGDFIVTEDVVANNFQLSSDINLKENIKPITSKDIIDIDWKSFNMKKDDTKSKRYGVIAQELEETNPELVKTNAKGEKSVLYIDLLIAKIAELEARLDKLEN
ncbi:tail fiber domain-containing protein [Polaribacter sp. L3A8]|uniref:tail fiber domain-containing protein n=1 Tax=Polaribacter sp. L3A8 TaxID=2686361 RepID=UPI00131B60B9|nr:tail fiber domain-containing protein [Polaribacter sp. L3A8]